MEPYPDRQKIFELANGFKAACLLGAAAELDLWTLLGEQRLSAAETAMRLRADLRATMMLLDALAALRLLDKQEERYSVPPALRLLLEANSPATILPMLRHLANVLRGWSQLAWTVRAGIPAPRTASIGGPEADRAAFVAGMHAVSGPIADGVVAELQSLQFTHLLDVGGASGTWTLAFLRAAPQAMATIFDLPDAVEQARSRLAGTQFAPRVALVAGDFYRDPLPPGADLAWVSAVAHQHSRQHNRELFAKVFAALRPGGRIAVRDFVVQPSRTQPADGALFAINMLVNTETGGTFTFAEFAEDLQAAGFANPQWLLQKEDMNSVVAATKP